MLAACKTLAFPQKAAKAESAIQGRSCGATALLVVRLLGRDGLWRLERRLNLHHAGARNNGHRVACRSFELFREARGAGAPAACAPRPADRIRARGPHTCERERERASAGREP